MALDKIKFECKARECNGYILDIFGANHVHLCSGYETSIMRKEIGLPKDHYFDAIAVYAACSGEIPTNLEGLPECHRVKQFRRHNRAIINNQRERTYKLDGKVVAKNRKSRFEQPKSIPALSEAGLTQEQVSQLKVIPSRRRYNNCNRILPGASYLVDGKICVMTGQYGYGAMLLFKYDMIDDKGNAIAKKAKDCKLLKKNAGLVFIS